MSAAAPDETPIEELLELGALSSAPYPIYRRLRDASPVLWSDRLDAWLVSRWSDAKEVLDDPRASRVRAA